VVLIHFKSRDGEWSWTKVHSYDPQRDTGFSGAGLKERKAFELISAGCKVISICASDECVSRCPNCTFRAEELLVQDAIKTICQSKNPAMVADALNKYVEIAGDDDDIGLWLFFKAMNTILRYAPESEAAQKWWKALEESDASVEEVNELWREAGRRIIAGAA
jgi:hypothetical protein